MRIKSAEVHDPRRTSGVLEAPYLAVQVDEKPTPLGQVLTTASPGPQLTFVQHGPFWHVEPHATESIAEDVLAGYANYSSATRLDKVVPVEVWYAAEDESVWQSMFLPVQRARSLLRKNGQDYQYIVSDVAARHGRIQWDLESRPIMCMHWLGSAVCAEPRISDIVNINGVQLPACRDHITATRKVAQNLRLERSRA